MRNLKPGELVAGLVVAAGLGGLAGKEMFSATQQPGIHTEVRNGDQEKIIQGLEKKLKMSFPGTTVVHTRDTLQILPPGLHGEVYTSYVIELTIDTHGGKVEISDSSPASVAEEQLVDDFAAIQRVVAERLTKLDEWRKSLQAVD